MPIEPGTGDDPNSAEGQKQQANQQKSIAKLANERKILNDTLTSRSIALRIINIAKRLSSKDYQRKLKDFILEKILRRRRGRGRTLVDTATAEGLEQRKKKEEQVPTMLTKDPAKPPLLFSQGALLNNANANKPTPDNSQGSRVIPEEPSKKRKQWLPRLSPFNKKK